MDLMLVGKRALIAGGTRGLGLAMAKQLLAEGANVSVCSRSANNVATAIADLRNTGGTVIGEAADVGDAGSYLRWIENSAKVLGGADIFIFNTSAEGTNSSDETWRRSLEIDLLGAKRGVEALTPHLVASGAGSILFTTSVAAVEQMLGPFAYNAVKAALLNYAKNLSAALGPQGVRVNCLSPGPIQYPGGGWERVEKNVPALYEVMRSKTDLGHFGAPEDIGYAAAFLVSPAAKYITGINLLVDGGTSGHVGG
jgi:3-oxoacyl-[acyl-carrier protein] reductase